jgi:PmbA protein
MMNGPRSFFHTTDNLREIARNILDWALSHGAGAAEAEVSEDVGQSVTVRQGEVETIEHNRDKGLSVTVYIGKQRGHASTSDFSTQAVQDTVEAALAIARHTAADDCAGLADADLLARDIIDLDLFHPWGLTVEQAVELAKECEAAAFAADPRVSNSEGATVTTQDAQFIYANSLAFMAGYASSRHAISCAVIAGRGEAMQRDDWYSTARYAQGMESARAVGRRAGERCCSRLAARKIKTVQAPVLFEAPIASSLLGHFVAAASGGSLYRKASFLLDQLGRQIFAPWIEIKELPYIPRGLASSAFDHEGVSPQPRSVVEEGVLQGYFLGSYSARKLGMRSTGNAGGNYNLVLSGSGLTFPEMIKKMGTGLVVTELLGHGVNLVTGDYSRGAAGFWVENGEIAYPVQEITVAGNLKDMFLNIAAAGDDVVIRGSRQCGSILIERMTVAGE